MNKIRVFIENNYSISVTVGLILMVAITVAIVATMFVIFNEIGGSGEGVTPNVGLTVDKSQDQNSAMIVINSITDKNIDWSDVSAIYVCLSNNTQMSDDSIETIRTSGNIVENQIITVSGCVANNEYRFALSYDKTAGLMGSVKWTQ